MIKAARKSFTPDLLFFFFIGAIVGFVGGYAGIGGAPILITLLVVGKGFSQHAAQGTILAVMLGPMSLFGVWAIKEKLKNKWDLILISVLTFAVFSYFGGAIAYLFSDFALKKLFGIVLLLLSSRYILKVFEKTESQPGRTRIFKLNYPVMFLFSIITGSVGGLFGIGSGLIMVPVFNKLFGFDKDTARGLSLAILLPPVSIGAVYRYQFSNDVHWLVAILIFFGYFLTNYFGSRMALTHSEKKFSFYFGSILLLLGLLYLSPLVK
ncbi:sulfite exporter TauE/SafE family protein [Candidatus Riflebacteria bacterium]